MPKSINRREAASNRLNISVGEHWPELHTEARETNLRDGVFWMMLVVSIFAVCITGALVFFEFKRNAEVVQILSSLMTAVVSLIAVLLARRSIQVATSLKHTDVGNRMDDERLRAHEAETATLIRALEVFGDSQRALEWMRESNPALNNEPPIRTIQTEDGRREVLNVLGRIQHGVIS